jgi:uncharacterized membrane protein
VIFRRSWAIAFLAVLVLSLAGNLFVAGLVAGGRLGRDEPPQGSLIDRAVSRFSQDLPPEGKQAVRAAFVAHRTQIMDQIHKLRDARRTVSKLIQAPTIDKAALEQSLAHLRDETAAAQNIFHQVLEEATLAMPASVRAGWWPPIMGKL